MPMLRVLLLVGALAGCTIMLVAIAGFVKFNILQDDIFVENEQGGIVPLD